MTQLKRNPMHWKIEEDYIFDVVEVNFMERHHLSQSKKAISLPQPENTIARSSTHPIEYDRQSSFPIFNPPHNE
jgi:hypothetical protein